MRLEQPDSYGRKKIYTAARTTSTTVAPTASTNISRGQASHWVSPLRRTMCSPLPIFFGTPSRSNPTTTITSGPSGSVRATSASFGFSSSAPGSTFECSLDGATFSACTSPKEYSGLANGEHTSQVRAIGTGGGTDPTPASHTWTVDTTGPDASITGGPTRLVDPRSVSFTFSGAEPGGGYECKIDGADSTGTFSACSSGDSFSVQTDGIYTFSEDMMSSSINGTTFKLMKAGTTTAIGAVVSYDPTTKKATLNPNVNLQLGTKYKAVVTAGAKDLAGNALDQNSSLDGPQPKQWVFTVRR
jgi:hypothetical protein